MIKLFLSHASEDKEDFVRPLAEALSPDFQVWFDEYELVLGDSLLAKIDAGLRSCDYGVVVLSQNFFTKRWPKAELDGLFGLETKERKIILPIWKDVTEEEVKIFSPILASRLAVSTGLGIEKIVQEIKKSVGVVGRYKTLEKDAWTEKFLNLDKDLGHRKAAEKLSFSTEGVRQVGISGRNVIAEARERVEGLKKQLSSFGFRFYGDKIDPDSVGIIGPSDIFLYIGYHCSSINNADDARLIVKVFKGRDSYTNDRSVTLEKFEFTPGFDRELKVFWSAGERKMVNTAVLDFAFEMFAEHIRTEVLPK